MLCWHENGQHGTTSAIKLQDRQLNKIKPSLSLMLSSIPSNIIFVPKLAPKYTMNNGTVVFYSANYHTFQKLTKHNGTSWNFCVLKACKCANIVQKALVVFCNNYLLLCRSEWHQVILIFQYYHFGPKLVLTNIEVFWVDMKMVNMAQLLQ